MATHWLRSKLAVLAIVGIACSALSAQEKTANYIATIGDETDRLQITVFRQPDSEYGLRGYLDISKKQPSGPPKTRRIPITGTASTDGVPATITIPSSTMGVPDLTLGCFFD